MDTKNAPLVMYIHDGTKLEVNCELRLTIDGFKPEAEEVIDFLIEFAKDSMKDPVEPEKSFLDIVKDVAMQEELKKEQEKDNE